MENEFKLGWQDATTFNLCRENLDALIDDSKHNKFRVIWNWIKSGQINMKVAYALIEYIG